MEIPDLRRSVFIALAKLTLKNQLTLPKAVTGSFHGVEYFDFSIANSCIVLAPVEIQMAGAVRATLSMATLAIA